MKLENGYYFYQGMTEENNLLRSYCWNNVRASLQVYFNMMPFLLLGRIYSNIVNSLHLEGAKGN